MEGISIGADNTSALAAGGAAPSQTGVVELWNGTNWTEVNDLNTARSGNAGFGIATAAIVAGGYPDRAITESWNGSNWTEVNDLNTGRDYLAGAGLQTAGIVFGGTDPSPEAFTEDWNGVSWAEVADLNTGRNSVAGAGTTTNALAFGGQSPVTGATEEWSGSTIVTKSIDTD